MIDFLTVLFMVVGVIGLIGFFAYAICWIANEEETAKDCEEVDNESKTDDI